MGQNNQILDFKECHLHECYQSALIKVISQSERDVLGRDEDQSWVELDIKAEVSNSELYAKLVQAPG